MTSLNLSIKEQLLAFCHDEIKKKLATTEAAMKAAQDAANSESKSTAGDKHDTARAMMHIERDKNARQLDDLIQQQNMLNKINSNESHNTVRIGSVVITRNGNFYISIGMGKICVGDYEFYAISTLSPIGRQLVGHGVGDVVNFNNKVYEIVDLV